MFMEHITISNYAKMAFLEQAMEIVGPPPAASAEYWFPCWKFA